MSAVSHSWLASGFCPPSFFPEAEKGLHEGPPVRILGVTDSWDGSMCFQIPSLKFPTDTEVGCLLSVSSSASLLISECITMDTPSGENTFEKAPTPDQASTNPIGCVMPGREHTVASLQGGERVE